MAQKETAKKRGISVRIDRLFDLENSKLKAIASADLGNGIAVHGLRVYDSQNGLFVQMPQERYQKDGETVYTDLFHPVTAGARNDLYGKVLKAYENALEQKQSEEQPEQDNAPVQTM